MEAVAIKKITSHKLSRLWLKKLTNEEKKNEGRQKILTNVVQDPGPLEN